MTFNFERKQFFVFIISFVSLLISFFFRPALEIVDNNFYYYLTHLKFDSSLFYFYYFKDSAFLDVPTLGVHPLYIIPSLFWQLGFPWFTSLVSIIGIPLLLFRLSRFRFFTAFFWFAWFITMPFLFVFSDSIALLWLAGLSVTWFVDVLNLHTKENSIKLILYIVLFLIVFSLIYLPSILLLITIISIQTFQSNKKILINSFALFFIVLVLFFVGLSFVPPLTSLIASSVESNNSPSITHAMVPSIHSAFSLFHWLSSYFMGYRSLYNATGEHFLLSVVDNFFINGVFYITIISLLITFVINTTRKKLMNNYSALLLFLVIILAYLLFLSRMTDTTIITSALVLFALQIDKINKVGLSTKITLSVILLFQSYAYLSGARFIFKHDSMFKPPQTWLLSYKDISKFNFSPNSMKQILFSDLRLIPQNVEFAQKANKAGENTILSAEAFEFFKRELEISKTTLTQLSKTDYSVFLNGGIHPAKETEPYSRARNIWNTHFKDKRYTRSLIINE